MWRINEQSRFCLEHSIGWNSGFSESVCVCGCGLLQTTLTFWTPLLECVRSSPLFDSSFHVKYLEGLHHMFFFVRRWSIDVNKTKPVWANLNIQEMLAGIHQRLHRGSVWCWLRSDFHDLSWGYSTKKILGTEVKDAAAPECIGGRRG